MHVLGWLLFIFTIKAQADCDTTASTTALRFGVPPWSSSAAADFWSKQIGEPLQTQLCQPIRFLSDANYREFVRSALTQRYDLLQTPPHIGLYLQHDHGFVILARDKHRVSSIVYFTHSESAVTQLADLAGQTLATPDELGFVSLFVRAHWRHSSAPPQFVTIDKHDKVVDAVARKNVVAGAVFAPMLASVRERRAVPIKIIGEEAISAEGFLVASPQLPTAQQRRIQQIALTLDVQDSAMVQQYQMISAEDIARIRAEFRGEIDGVARVVEGER